MRLGAVLHSVVAHQEVHEPGISFLLILWLVKVVEGLVHLLYSAKWPLDLTFRAGCPFGLKTVNILFVPDLSSLKVDSLHLLLSLCVTVVDCYRSNECVSEA
jgi:hypothetical protein